MEDLKKSLISWISRISDNTNEAICPYAMGAWIKNEVILYEDGKSIPDLIPLPDNISVCVVPRMGISYDDLGKVCDYYNEIFPEYLFLDTHPDETLRLRGQKTVWDYPAVIIQKKRELLEARSILVRNGFYKNWDRDLLEDLEIF